MECIFCKIINKKMDSEIVFENDKVIAVKDINPQSPVHILIIPKKHINSVNEVGTGDRELMGDLILTAKGIANEKKLNDYRLFINVGRKGGQVIDHLHMHLVSK